MARPEFAVALCLEVFQPPQPRSSNPLPTNQPFTAPLDLPLLFSYPVSGSRTTELACQSKSIMASLDVTVKLMVELNCAMAAGVNSTQRAHQAKCRIAMVGRMIMLKL